MGGFESEVGTKHVGVVSICSTTCGGELIMGVEFWSVIYVVYDRVVEEYGRR